MDKNSRNSRGRGKKGVFAGVGGGGGVEQHFTPKFIICFFCDISL
tara:strand:- start:24 stop:158 length:135 start_codon:yes stop_codon:yes gene_type:complete